MEEAETNYVTFIHRMDQAYSTLKFPFKKLVLDICMQSRGESSLGVTICGSLGKQMFLLDVHTQKKTSLGARTSSDIISVAASVRAYKG